MASRWSWQVTCFYNDTVKPPRKPGELAIRTVHTDETSRDIEVETARSRPDIGTVDIVRLT